MSLTRVAPLKLTRVLPPASTFRFAHLCRSRPRGSIRSLLPSQLYLAPLDFFRSRASHPPSSRLRRAEQRRCYTENADATPAATRLRLALAGLRRGKQIAEFIHHKPLMIW